MNAEFEKAARAEGFENFRREHGKYCHADLEIFYRGWLAAKSSK